MLINPDPYVKTTYLNLSQRLSMLIDVYCCKGTNLIHDWVVTFARNRELCFWYHERHDVIPSIFKIQNVPWATKNFRK